MINFDVAPYYDDYDETKLFQRIMFKPGTAVQARELTQLQTILQKQIERHGEHIFKDGSKVIDGGITMDTSIKHVKLEPLYITTSIDVNDYLGKIITNSGGSNAQARVIAVEAAEGGNPDTLLIHYINGYTFAEAENIATNDGTPINATVYSSSATGDASVCSIDNGVYFVNGFFVHVNAQTIILEKYSADPDYRVGLSISESFIESTDANTVLGNTLLDPAQGSYNYSAPGADRYKIELTLVKKPISGGTDITNNADVDFVELMRTETGEVTKQIEYTEYNELEGNLARRLFDQSGDYTIKSFPARFEDHSSNTELFNIVLEPGKAYVKGYEFETIGNSTLEDIRTRTYDSENNFDIYTNFGNYCLVSGANGFFETDTMEKLDLHSLSASSIVSTNSQTYTASTIGTTRIRQLRYNSGDAAGPYVYKLHLFDTKFVSLANTATAGSTTTITLATDASSIDDCYNGALITITGGGANGDVRSILDYVGSTRVATVNTAFFETANTLSTYNISFGFKDTESLVTVDGSFALQKNFDIDVSGKEGLISTGDAKLHDTVPNSLVFPFPQSEVKTLKIGGSSDSDYVCTRVFTSITFTGGQATIQTLNGDERFYPSPSEPISESAARDSYIVVVTNAQSSGYANGDIIYFDTAGGNFIDLPTPTGGVAADATFDVSSNETLTFTADILATININTAVERVKAKVTGNTTHCFEASAKSVQATNGQLHIASPNKIIGGIDSTEISDGWDLIKVVDSQDSGTAVSNTDMTDTSKDITSRYTFDNGQRDNFYDHSSISLNPGNVPPAGQICIVIDYHTTTGKGFSSVDSYSDYTNINEFDSPTTESYVNLRDVVDFRPIRRNNNLDDPPILDNIQIPISALTFECDYEYYLGRIDKITLTSEKEFAIVRGVPSLEPEAPTVDADSMTLYTMDIPAYLFDPGQINLRYIDNRRFTMRDIGNISKRVSRLEYYTSFSLLEQQTTSIDIKDTNGNDRFKNGIFIDVFTGHAAAETDNIDYNCSVDFENNILRPPFIKDQVPFLYDSAGSTNITQDGDLLTLDYTLTPYITQALSSKSLNVNPYNIVNYIGSLNITPESDTWIDTVRRPTVSVNLMGENDAWERMLGNVAGTRWNDWQTIGQGIENRDNGSQGWRTSNIERRSFPPFLRRTWVRTINQSQVEVTRQNRAGVRIDVTSETVTRDLGDRIVDISVVPFMRSRNGTGGPPRYPIVFVGRSMKPNTVMYPFFDDVDVSSYCGPCATIQVTGASGLFRDNPYELITWSGGSAQVAVDSTVNGAGTIHIFFVTGSSPNGNVITGSLSGSTATVTSYVAKSLGTITTNGFGEIAGEFQLPSSDALHFRTGEKNLKLTDSSINDNNSAISAASAQYFAQGMLQTRQGLTVSTRMPIIQTTMLNEGRRLERTVGQTNRTVTRRGGWFDPLAQTFLVNRQLNPNGIFIKNVRICFATKDDTVQPVTLEIRPTVNGYPHSHIIIPFARKTLKPAQVNITTAPDFTTSTEYTQFDFPSPVYLQPGEYAIVVHTNSLKYEIYVAQMGGIVIGGSERITKQPYAGVLFKSQNSSTWTPNQEEDIMFQVNRCDFSSSNGTIQYHADDIGSTEKHYELFNITTSDLNFANTAVEYSYRSTFSANNFLETVYTGCIVNTNNRLKAERQLDANSNTSFFLQAEVSSEALEVSPVIDISRLALTFVDNVVNNGELTANNITITDGGTGYDPANTTVAISGGGGSSWQGTVDITANVVTGITVTNSGKEYIETPLLTITDVSGVPGTGATAVVNGETDASGGNITAKYISQRVTLEDGFDAKDLKCYFDFMRLPQCRAEVYYKVLSADDPDVFAIKKWIKFQQLNATTVFSDDEEQYLEYSWFTSNDPLQPPITYTSDDGLTTYENFKSFQIKIVMLSNNSAFVPKIKNLRVIALDQ